MDNITIEYRTKSGEIKTSNVPLSDRVMEELREFYRYGRPFIVPEFDDKTFVVIDLDGFPVIMREVEPSSNKDKKIVRIGA